MEMDTERVQVRECKSVCVVYVRDRQTEVQLCQLSITLMDQVTEHSPTINPSKIKSIHRSVKANKFFSFSVCLYTYACYMGIGTDLCECTCVWVSMYEEAQS